MITTIEGKPVTGLLATSAQALMLSHPAGQPLTLGIDRDGTPLTIGIVPVAPGPPP